MEGEKNGCRVEGGEESSTGPLLRAWGFQGAFMA